MNEELINNLLNTKTEHEFFKLYGLYSMKYGISSVSFPEEVKQHCHKLIDLSFEEPTYPVEHYLDDEEYAEAFWEHLEKLKNREPTELEKEIENAELEYKEIFGDNNYTNVFEDDETYLKNLKECIKYKIRYNKLHGYDKIKKGVFY